MSINYNKLIGFNSIKLSLYFILNRSNLNTLFRLKNLLICYMYFYIGEILVIYMLYNVCTYFQKNELLEHIMYQIGDPYM